MSFDKIKLAPPVSNETITKGTEKQAVKAVDVPDNKFGLTQDQIEEMRSEFQNVDRIVTALPDIGSVRDFARVLVPWNEAGERRFTIWQALEGKWYFAGITAQKDLHCVGASEAYNATASITLTTQNVLYDVAGFTNYHAHNVKWIAPEFEIQVAGDYMIVWHISFALTGIGATNQDIEGGLIKNGVNSQQGWAHANVATASTLAQIGSNAIMELKANDRIKISVQNTTSGGKMFTTQHASFTIFRIR